jgi:plasmid stability protein
MAAITIRKLEPQVKERLRIRAARHGRSMEDEARAILRSATAEGSRPVRLAGVIRRRFERFRGVVLALPHREPARPPPKFR